MSEFLRSKLLEKRKALGISQRAMAGRLGVPYQTYVQWEQNRHSPAPLSEEALLAKLEKLQ